jgi:lysozyme
MTALVSLSASGVVTGFSVVPSTPAQLASPTGTNIWLLALQKSAQPAAPTSDAALRSAIVNVASYYLRMAADKTPAEMEAIIWQHDSLNGVDHGESCAAFASLTLELASQVVGEQSWVSGGSTYPWPVHSWVDSRVDPNAASPSIVSVLSDAESQHRWHPLGDGYKPQPGDWVLFNQHVEVVTKDAGGVLYTIGGDSLPNFSVNSHEYPGSLSEQGVAGFVNNGQLAAAPSGGQEHGQQASGHKQSEPESGQEQSQSHTQLTAIPGLPPASSATGVSGTGSSDSGSSGSGSSGSGSSGSGARGNTGHPAGRGPAPAARAQSAHVQTADGRTAHGQAQIAGLPQANSSEPADTPQVANAGTQIPGLSLPASHQPAASGYARTDPSTGATALPSTRSQQAFIFEVAPGAMASQREYGVPAAVTIAQAIDESGWGQSTLSTQDHNLFGIKGAGPAGSDPMVTEEYVNGEYVTVTSQFRVYTNVTQSIEDHGKLLATSGYYTKAMAVKHDPDAFATALTGVYATDPDYGAKLIGLMQRYDLYRFDATTQAEPPRTTHPAAHAAAQHPAAQHPAATATKSTPAQSSHHPAATSPPRGAPQPTTTPSHTASPPTVHTSPVATSRGSASSGGRAASGRASGRASRAASPASGAPIGGASIPGFDSSPGGTTGQGSGATASGSAQSTGYQRTGQDGPVIETLAARRTSAPAPASASAQSRKPAARSGRAPSVSRTKKVPYQHQMPAAVQSAFVNHARGPVLHEELLYRDVAGESGIPWKFLAACDWMQCEARSRYSPVHGERLGSVNRDGSVYRTRSSALAQCADDLILLARAVYGIDLTTRAPLSVLDLANVFAAFRWGGLLKLHRTSAMDFPYSVAGLTAGHLNMRWPDIDEPNAPDKPGSRFRMTFGAVPLLLNLGYPATV